MLRTIMIGKYLSIQGVFVRMIGPDLALVRVGSSTYAGRPVRRAA